MSFSSGELMSESFLADFEKLKQIHYILSIYDICALILIIFIVAYFLKTSASKNNFEMSYGKAILWTILSMFIAWLWALAPLMFWLNYFISAIVFFVLFFYILYFSLKWNFKLEAKQANKISTRTIWFMILFWIISAVLKVGLSMILLNII